MAASPLAPFTEGEYRADAAPLPVQQANWQLPRAGAEGVSFIEAARRSTPSVVFIKALAGDEYAPTSYFDLLFGRRSGPMAASGSGVIYAEDGYIITNNHVVEGAKTVEVVHQRRTYKAAVVGTDPATDLAVLKIEANGLPAINLGRSAAVEVGEWALAVGNPFNLTSTVTAGIVSAKGREISFGKGLFPLESFIQTDAAINPGNSGGALVNSRGELIGINTAILSQTGSYAGYGFAVPVDVVRKVAEDLIQYGEVQKAFVGAEVIDLDLNKARELNVKADRGVVVSHVAQDGAAARAGLKPGDVIVRVNDIPVESRGQFDELVSYYSPGDRITLGYIRRNQPQQTQLTLTNREGNTSVLRREVFTSQTLGADLEKISKVERDVLNIPQGVRVTNIRRGFMRRLGLEDGFVITSINETPIDDPEKLVQVLSRLKGRVIIEGVNTKGVKGYYQYYF
ncbi:trypsin-like peptidase domain-containing protein [Cesiribacter andamanensis]|uniref:Periplasmic serine endoprotease DegP n=1 Tax=Cesiribacter andamanensis AMV16 TaxID=1279009 RepID=M7N487_9BACT|nr:trypsin-like peptidase domain-containing protein [Cesiribacter andamanensis]EMR03488.1 Periplasmic serine endoprotease DegP precursor [Cesiribacter andamanensis AMV16]